MAVYTSDERRLLSPRRRRRVSALAYSKNEAARAVSEAALFGVGEPDLEVQVLAIAAGADDRRVYVQGASYAAAMASTPITPAGAAAVQTQRALSGGIYTIGSALLRWNTSALSPEDLTGAAAVRVRVLSRAVPDNPLLGADWFVWDGTTADFPSALPEFDACPLHDYRSATTDLDYHIPLRGIRENLNNGGDGYTYLRLYLWLPIAEPTGNNHFNISSFEDALGNPSARLALEIAVTEEEPGGGTVPLTGAESEESAGTLSALPGDATRALAGPGTEETNGALAAQPGAASLALSGAATEESAGTLTASTTTTLSLPSAASDEAAGTLAATPGTATRALVGPATEETNGALTAVAGGTTRSLAGAATEEQNGTLTPSPGAASRALAPAATEESAGTLSAAPGTAQAILAGAATEETGGSLSPTPGTTARNLTGAASEETGGALTPQAGATSRALSGAATEETGGALVALAGGVAVTLLGAPAEETAGTLVPFEVPSWVGPVRIAPGSLAIRPKIRATGIALAGKPAAVSDSLALRPKIGIVSLTARQKIRATTIAARQKPRAVPS